MNIKNLILGIATVSVIGCAGQAAEEQTTESTKGAIEVSSLAETSIKGTYDLAGDKMRFEATKLGETAFSVTLKFHGVTLDATIDTSMGKVTHQDGFSDDGKDTSLTEDDQAYLFAFVKAFEAKVPDIAMRDGVAQPFASIINLWGQWIPAMDVKFTKFEDAEHATNLCGYARCTVNGVSSYSGSCSAYTWYNYASHDCWNCSNGSTNCSSPAQLGDHSAPTWYWIGSWTSSTQDHKSRPNEVGDCNGRYGAGCGSGHAYNLESLNHDHCVRNGHVITSSWCSDELMYATDSTGNCY